MKNVIRIAILLMVLLAFLKLYDANPSKAEYIDWVSQQAENQQENILMKGLISLVAGPFLNETTTQSDYLLFSIFESDLTDIGLDKIKVLGILGKFIPLTVPGTFQ